MSQEESDADDRRFIANLDPELRAMLGLGEVEEGEDDDYIDGEWADEDEVERPRLTGEERRSYAVAAALAPRTDTALAQRQPPKPRMARLPEGSGQTAACVFGEFPCYAERLATEDFEAYRGIRRAKSQRPAGTANGGRAVQGRRRARPVDDLDKIAVWVRENGIQLGANTLRFPENFVGYVAEVVFAVSEDRSYLFVREQRGPHGENRYIYEWEGGRRFYAENLDAVDDLSELIGAPNGKDILISGANADAMLEAAQEKHAQRRIAKRASNVAIAAPTRPAPEASAPDNTEVEPAPTRPATVPEATTEARQKPSTAVTKRVTQPSKAAKPAAPSSRFLPLAALKEVGMSQKLVPASNGKGTEKVFCKEQEDGRFLTVLSGDAGVALPQAKTFSVEIRTDVKTPGEQLGTLEKAAGRETFLAELENIIENIPASGPRP